MKKYRPSNGTEGDWFEHKYCGYCVHQHPDPEQGKNCDIAMRAFCFDENGWPTCTKWKKWDWGNDGDPNDPENPKYTPPADPCQLVLPFLIEETLKQTPNETNKTRSRQVLGVCPSLEDPI